MSGGTWEYVMGNYNNKVGSSGFSSMPESKYYDVYTSSNPSSDDSSLSATACSGGICYGHGLSEVMNWYFDNAVMISINYPWFLRGGGYGFPSNAGVFGIDDFTGSTGDNTTSRLVLAPSA